MISRVKVFLFGIVFGITQTVPGVSGGTVAIMLGFYETLLESVNHFREDWRRHIRFLIMLFGGTAAGIVAFSSVVTWLLAKFPSPIMLFFIGLIIGIVPLTYAKAKSRGGRLSMKGMLYILIPALALMATAHMRAPQNTAPAEVISNIGIPYMLFLFAAGVVCAAAMVIPGVSGSFILLLMGAYNTVMYSVSSIRHLLADFTDIYLMLDICKVLIPFGIGVIIGAVSMVRLAEMLLKRYEKQSFCVITGLLAGSVYVLLRNPGVLHSGISVAGIIIGGAALILGAVISFLIGKRRI